MPDDYDGDGAPPSGPGGKRRAPDPDPPRRRRRSLDDDGGLSVSDLVERHTGSRADLPAVGRRHAAEDPAPHVEPPAGRRRAAEEPRRPGGIDESRHAAPDHPRKRGGVEDLGAAMQGRRAAAEQSDAPPSRHGRRPAPEQPPGRAPRSGEARPAPEPPARRAPRRPVPGPAGGPPMPPAEPGGPQRASVPADVVRQATGAHRVPGDAGLDFDQFVPAEPPRRPAPPRPAPGPPLPEPTRPGDHVEDDRPSRHYPLPGRHEPFPRDRPAPQQPDDHFPADPRGPEEPFGRPAPQDARPRRRPAAPHQLPQDVDGEPFGSAPGQLPTGRRPSGQHPLPPPETGHRPHEPVDGPPRRGPGQRSLPPHGDPLAQRGPHPGPRQPTGQHPLPELPRPPHGTGQHPLPELPRPPHGTGQHPLPPLDQGRPHPTGQHPLPRPATGQHPLPPEARRGPNGPQPPGRFPQPTGAMPLPGGLDGEAFPDDRSPFPEPPQPSGRFPVDQGADDIAARLTGDGKPRIPRQQPPGQSSMPNQGPNQGPGQGQGGPEETQKVGLTPPPGVTPAEAVGMTTEMEPIGEATQKRRRVDETLARFSKVHDELKAEERAKKAKRRMPWNAEDDELNEQLDELAKPPGEEAAQDEEKPKPKKRGLFARVFAGTTAILVFAGMGVGWGFLKHTGDSIDKVRALDPNSAAIQNAEGQRGDENFLLVGSDSREGAAAEDGVGDANQVPGARADTMMIAHVPADRSRVVIVSFPRDLEISRPDCERFDSKTNSYTGETVPGQQVAKLNSAYQVGGPLCATKVVQEISGLRVTRFIGIDFTGFKGMVDAVDGVTVCVEEPMYDTFLKKWIVRKAGTAVELRGDQALDFVRSRHVRNDVTSDYGRIKRQQRFLSSLLRKSMSGQVLLDPAKLTNFTEAFTKSTFGDNITIESLFSLGQSLGGLDAGRVTFLTVPTVGISNDRGNEDLRVEDNAALFRAIVNNQPLPGEKPAPKSETDEEQRALPQSSPLRARQQQVDPKKLKVQVLNGGNPTGGMARRTADALAGHGYQIVLVNSAPKVPSTVIYYGTGNEAAARTLASSVPGVALKAEPGMGKALVLVLGPDYDGEVVPPGTAEVAEPEQEKLPEDLSAINGGDVRCA